VSDVPTSGWGLFRVLPRALPYTKPYWKLGCISIGMTVLTAVLSLLQPWPLALMVDTVSGERESVFGLDRMTLLFIVVIAGFVLTVLVHGLNVGNSFVDSTLEQNMVLDLRSDLFAHCERLSLAFHDARRTGELMSRINYQAAALGTVVMALPPLVESVLTLIGMTTIALLIDWRVTLISLTVAPLVYYALGLYGTRVVPRLRDVQGLEWQSLSIVNEAMSMLRVIVSFGREGYEHGRFREQGKTAVDARVQLTVRQTAFTLGVQTATALGTALVFFFGFRAVFNGDITIGEFIVLASYIAAIYAPLEAISNTVGMLNAQLVALQASFELLDLEPEVREHDKPLELDRADGRVTFEVVGFAYAGRQNTLRDVSFDISAGSRVAIVGPTGAGKTTLVSLMIRFYDPHHGQLGIDGIDIKHLSLASLRRQFAVVLQEPLLFSGTIAENIRYGRLDASDEEVVEAAIAANADEFVSRLPKGYATELGERGAHLSGGERQRICIARAFIKDAPILVMDEPTSSIDSRTENVILDALDNLMIGRTSFMIAHRLSTVRDADLILVLNHGEIVQRGTHDELIELEGLYRELHDAQTRRKGRANGRASLALAASGEGQ
jgi:ATP-binding cassette subfamily B protein